MKKLFKKKDFPVHQIRRFLEPGPIVLISSYWEGKTNIMTQGWHTVLEFLPSTIGCLISSGSHSFEMIRKSGECVVNIPTVDLIEKVVGIGNCSGSDVDKFNEFGLTSRKAKKVKAPLIGECYASFECRIMDDRMISDYNFFIFEVLKAHVSPSPPYPKTMHYTGDGIFMLSGEHVNYSAGFKPEML